MLGNPAMLMRAVSVFIPLVFIVFGSIFLPNSQAYWIIILTITMCVGYVHFFIGTVYQLDGIKRKPQRKTNLLLFIGITLIAFGICRLFIDLGWEILLGAFTIIYFVIHVLLNEKTFLQAQAGIKIGYFNILSFTALIVPPFLLALVHPSFFYDFTLRYPKIDSLQYRQIIEAFIPMDFLFTASLAVIGAFILIIPYRLFRQHGFLTALITGTLGVIVLLAILWTSPLNFVYLLHFVLMYHFILLFFIFLQYFSNKSRSSVLRYISLHVFAVGAIVSVASIPLWQSDTQFLYKVYENVFNFGNFLTISIMHVSVSFLNEPWFTRLFQRSS